MKNKRLAEILNTNNSFSWLLTLFFIFIVGGFIILSILFYQNNHAIHITSERVIHTRDVIEQAEQVAMLTKDMQWQSRSYLITADTSALKVTYIIQNTLLSAISELKDLTADNPLQERNIGTLKAELDTLINFIDQSFLLRKKRSLTLIELGENYQKQNKFYSVTISQIKDIIAEENRLLIKRERDNSNTISANYIIFIKFGILIFLLLTGALILVIYHLKHRQKAEERILESETRYRTLINNIKDLAIYMTDPKGNIVEWYEGAYQVKGYKKEEIIGKNISIFYTKDSIDKGEPEENLLMAIERGSFETEGWRIRKDGSKFWADILIATVYDSDGKLEGFAKVTRDFSLHKKIEEERQLALEKEIELNKMKSNFVSLASHEFRTPLSTILSSVSLLENYRTTETQDKRDKHIQRIKSSVNDMVSILEEFLSLEKIEEGKAQPKNEIFDIQHILKDVCSRLHSIQKEGQYLECHHSGAENVYLDKGFITHIITNLVSNAIKYSSNEAIIDVLTSVEEGIFTLMVKDNGMGISHEDQKHLFERFFRASNTGNIKGTGLGLHIVKRYVDMMNGTISVKSELGKGSEFKIMVPCA